MTFRRNDFRSLLTYSRSKIKKKSPFNRNIDGEKSKRFVMNQADISQLVSKLKIRISPRHKNLKNPEGPQGRLKILRKTVNALFKYERLELNYTLADETRGYAERVNTIITVFILYIYICLFTCTLSKNNDY